jgi:threonine dehydratase
VFPVPTLSDVYAARSRVYRVVRPTPLLRHPLLAAETGLDILVKHENHNPTCAFKVRGGLQSDWPVDRQRAQRRDYRHDGNHGQSIALPASATACRARS